MEAHERLIARWKQDLSEADVLTRLPGGGHLYFTQGIGIAGTAHQVGTCRFGSDPRSSVLDPDCRAHELDNLYVADGSFFPSIGAVNPTLTIVANALRVADRIRERL
jgi:choline dehydrogenase-like flavoprotein